MGNLCYQILVKLKTTTAELGIFGLALAGLVGFWVGKPKEKIKVQII